ncbi:MAG: MarR family transcriptional regulator [Planctomycetota bacterium]
MLDFDFRARVCYWVHMAAHSFERTVNNELLSEGITYRQCQVLGWLAIEGDMSQVELADRMNIEPPTVVRVLDCMEREGWITRDACPTDRRKKVVRPLPRAIPVWEKITACGDRVEERALKGMTAEQVLTLRNLLEIVQRNLSDQAETVSSPASLETSDLTRK